MKKNKTLNLFDLLNEDLPPKKKLAVPAGNIPVVPATSKNMSKSQMSDFGKANTVQQTRPEDSATIARNAKQIGNAPTLPPSSPTPVKSKQLSAGSNLIPVSPKTMNRMRARDAELSQEDLDNVPLPPVGHRGADAAMYDQEDAFDVSNPFAGYVEDLPDGMSLQDYIKHLTDEADKNQQKPQPKLDSAFDQFEPTEDEQKELSLFNKKKSFSNKPS